MSLVQYCDAAVNVGSASLHAGKSLPEGIPHKTEAKCCIRMQLMGLR